MTQHIDKCLILAAGLGTRMGIIGQHLPKILWPIFDLTLLELQVAFAAKLGCKKIFMNAHFKNEQISTFINKSEFLKKIQRDKKIKFQLLYEEKLLLIGGAIYNLNSVGEFSGKILVLNGDQFIFFDEQLPYREYENLQKDELATLLCSHIYAGEGYNSLGIDSNGHLKEILPDQKELKGKKLLTYSGTSIVNLDNQKYLAGPQQFFTTVANYSKGIVKCVELDHYEYWDFGTVERYINSMFKIIESVDQNLAIHELLKNFGALNLEKLSKSLLSYHSEKAKNVINLAHEKFSGNNPSHERSIILDQYKESNLCGHGLYWHEFKDITKH